jgi:predicted Zn-dependent protease
MNQGVLLWKTGKLNEAVEWMRNAREALPNNMRILFNAAQILVSHLQKYGHDAALADEAREVLQHIERLQPGQQRFAQLMEQLALLAPAAPPEDEPAEP